ncbi:hypothetical protein V5799_017382 [Amblyomma americanum]|uniref:Uncharacterized protein n=1 Tax=Amblyomma americanum TaxID=6943 RepID=A0AAQ4F2F2_AMBAM
MLQGLDAYDREEEESLTGEPCLCADLEEEPGVLSLEGCGNARAGRAAIDLDTWQGLLHSYYGPVVSSCATVSVFLKYGVRVDISLERAVRVVNYKMNCTAAISSSGERSCACHPCGCVLQEGAYVHMGTGARLAKISSRGVAFTSLNRGLVYLVDASGTKSTTERFQNLTYDLALSVFNINPEPDVESFNE